MTTPSQVLRRAQEHGVHIHVDDDRLTLEASEAPPTTLVEAIRHNKAAIIRKLRSCDAPWSIDDWQTFFEERAGIAEFQDGQSRPVAEARAFEGCIAEWLNRNPEYSDEGLCAWCKQSDNASHIVLPFGGNESQNIWLHAECWHAWHTVRRAKAQEALQGIWTHIEAITR